MTYVWAMCECKLIFSGSAYTQEDASVLHFSHLISIVLLHAILSDEMNPRMSTANKPEKCSPV